MKKRLTAQEYEAGILSGNRAVLSKAITLVESTLEKDQDLAAEVIQAVLPRTGNAIRIGITGVPGVGKSTFIEAFGGLLIEAGKHVAVLAVDPTSQKTRGSILGDKTRMEKLSGLPQAFIRPSPSGNTLGGVSAKTREAMLLCEAAGYDVILVETVGVGQSETAVKGMVDFFLLLMLAGAGDELQGIKKGIMEMADALLIHKADQGNLTAAKQAKAAYQKALHLFPPSENQWIPQVVIGSSLTGVGLQETWDLILGYQKKMVQNDFWQKNRADQRLNWLDEHVQNLLGRAFARHEKVQELLVAQRQKVKRGEISPFALARDLTKVFLHQ